MDLVLFNSLTKRKEIFVPIDTNLIKMYVCGPTVYDHPHIGNARSVVVYDILYRVLIELYGRESIRYVRNITDIDDKIIDRASRDKITISELTEKTTQFFHSNMSALHCLSPTFEPKATDHIQEMIDIITRLLKQEFAYQANNHVYFDVTKYEDYTKLSGRSFSEMMQNVRVENDADKKHPEDFVLWKPVQENDDPSACFESPFGSGRPGWHIECSAMSYKYLGKTFDIHGGGADLIFPHHTNEIAQSCSAFPNSEFAKMWVHNGFLTVNHEKMSKSLGNFITVQNLLNKGVNGEVIKLFLLSGHYRKPIDYNDKAIYDMNKMLSYWYRAVEVLKVIEISPTQKLPEDFFRCLLDDLNTHNAITVINNFAKQAHSAQSDFEKIEAASNLLLCARFLGLMNSLLDSHDVSSDLIDQLIKERLAAKRNKDWT
ncbi:cysteine--tRNA ligase, partial [Rickettsiaceae bacterium]|nr:cysteine--tRNA ligase [Rickettsiaceae bacterium]